MRRVDELLIPVVALLSTSCCTPRREPPAAVPAASAVSIAPPPELDAGPPKEAPPPSEPAPPSTAAEEDGDTKAATQLATDLLGNGEPIAYSPPTSTFVYLLKRLEEGNGEGQNISFARAGEKPYEDLPVCEPWECEHEREARVEALVPALAARLRGKGYVLLTPLPWPSDADRIALAVPGVTLRWQKDHLIVMRAGKAPVALDRVAFNPPHTAHPEAVAVVPDGSWFAVRILFDPHAGYGQGYNFYGEVHSYRLP
jgi:hypothetical protein